jgi:Uma2 family endonuclease
LTVEKYEAMVASGVFTKQDRFVLIEGQLVEKMTNNPPHTVVTMLCAGAIHRALPPGWHAREEKPVRIPGRSSEPEPDVAVARGEPRDWFKQHPGPGDIAQVVEVADSSVAEDRALVPTYGGGDIPYYWLLNIPDRQVELYSGPSGANPPFGYRHCEVLKPGQEVPLVIDGREVARIAVDDLLPPP